MADKRIQDLTPASSVQTSDRFVLEQSGQAKSLTGQILINDLAAFLDGHGGINDISYSPPSTGELNGTLTITLADETVESFSVMNGRGIASLTKTGTSVLEDTYTITYNDGSTPTTFTVTNGKGIVGISYVESVGLDDYYQIDYNDGESTSFVVHNGEKGDTGDNWFVHIRWAAVMPTQDSDIVNYPSDFIGIYAGTSASAPTSFTEYQWYDYKGEKGDTGTSISSVSWVSSSGLVDTYRVNFSDGNSTTFNVTNGSQIDNIAKTSSSGLVDTYTVTLTNGNQTTFQVNNGKSIVSVTWTSTTSPTGVPHVPGATDTYTISYNDNDTTTFQIYNGLDGEGASITVDGIPSVNGNVPLLTIDTEHGAPTPQTVGSVKSRYFDAINSILYICIGYDENNGYIWRGAGATVDAALSTSSTNPVQNRVITNKIGTAALDTTAQDLSGAVNEILDEISGFADNLAEEYDPTATYAVGDFCIHDSVLYRCNTAISTPEAWNSIHWTATSVSDELGTLTNDIADINSEVGNTPLSTTAQTLTGAINELNTNKAPLASPSLTGTPTAPTASASTDNTQIATTEFANRAVTSKAATATPLMDGTAAVGTSAKFAREDHVHPQDSDIGALKTNLGQSGVSTNLNTVTAGKVQLLIFDATTSNTPNAQGITPYTAGCVLSYSSSDNYCIQYAYPAGANFTFVRKKSSGTWYPWTQEPVQTNPNLLDNWYFVGGGSQLGGGAFPINQKRQTSYNNTNAIDRWNANGVCTVTLNSGYITISSSSSSSDRAFLVQRFDNYKSAFLRGKTVTASILFSDGTFLFGSKAINTTGTTDIYAASNFALRYNVRSNGHDEFCIIVPGSGGSRNVVAVKLEFGEIQTLVRLGFSTYYLTEIPNYTEMLTRCQSYYYRTNLENSQYSTVGLASADTSSSINAMVSFPTTMISAPTVSSSGTINFQVGNNNYSTSSPSLSIYNRSAGCMQIHITGFSGLSTGAFGTVYTSNNGTLIFDANLN